MVTIKESSIEGLGLFATGNHSDDPNCSKLLMEDGSWWITTNQEIMAGEEITWGYTLYEIY